jgi:hypothetical protein
LCYRHHHVTSLDFEPFESILELGSFSLSGLAIIKVFCSVPFELPVEFRIDLLANPECGRSSILNILFHATTETLRTIAADPKHLGAEIGFRAVLHPWGPV